MEAGQEPMAGWDQEYAQQEHATRERTIQHQVCFWPAWHNDCPSVITVRPQSSIHGRTMFECHKCSGQVREAMKSIGPTMRTTAEPRPHCYIAGDHSGLKPFGAFPPVKPVPYHGSAKAL